MNELITQIATSLGLSPGAMAILLIIILMVCDKVSKAIPDDSTGFMKVIQSVAKFIAVDISSKVTAGASIREISRAVIQSNPEVAAKLDVPQDYQNTDQGTLDLTDEQRIRRFPPPGSGNTLGVILALVLVMPLLSGCATVGFGVQRACQNRDAALALVIALGNDKTSDYAIRVYRYVNAICPVVIDDINKGAIPGVTPVPLGVLPPPPPGQLH